MKSNSNELPISVPLSFFLQGKVVEASKRLVSIIKRKNMQKRLDKAND